MDGFNILEQFIRLTGIRHGILVSNIANTDTPNYKARDVRIEQPFNVMMELATTNPEHIKTSNSDLSHETEIDTTKPWADGNNVELDMEVAKMTENAILFQAGISMFSTKARMFKNALKVR